MFMLADFRISYLFFVLLLCGHGAAQDQADQPDVERVVQKWQQLASQEELDAVVVAETGERIRDVLVYSGTRFTPAKEKALLEHLPRLVENTKFLFQGGPQAREGASYWVAYVIGDFVVREAQSDEERKDKQQEMIVFVDAAAAQVQSELLARLSNEEKAQLAPAIERAMGALAEQVKRELLKRSNDPIYPGMKDSIADKRKERIMRHLQLPTHYFGFEEPEELMVTKAEFYQQRLDRLVRRLSGSIIRDIAYDQLLRRLAKTQFWGNMHVSLMGEMDSGWPLISLSPADGVNERRGWKRQ